MAKEGSAQIKPLDKSYVKMASRSWTVKALFEEMESKTDYVFVYPDDIIENKPKVKLAGKSLSVEHVLTEVAKVTGLKFKQVNNSVYVGRHRDIAIALENIRATIGGQVTSANEPAGIPGVTVRLKGSTTGTITDLDGKYSIEVPSETSILVFSSIGYATTEVVVGSRTEINVLLEEDTKALDEVVVVGYGQQKKASLTGAVASLKSEDLVQVPAANTSQLLTGRVPGLIAKQTSSLPGSDGATLNIRGYGSPLVLVDGIQMGLAGIDPNDIESISVLKDAAAAVYGARAGNGVILVTTKRGASEKARINYHGNYTLQEATAFRQHVGAGEWASLMREAELNLGMNPTYSEEEVAKFQEGTEPGYQDHRWVDALIDNFAPMQQHNLSVSQKKDNVRYYTSLGFTDQESVFRSRDFDYNRINVRSNVDVEINKNLNFGLDISYRTENTSRPLNDLGIIWNDLQVAQPRYPTELPDPTRVPYTGFNERNPIARTYRDISGNYDYNQQYFTGILKGEYKIPGVEGLAVRGQMNVMNRTQYTKNLSTPYDLYEYDYATEEYVFKSRSGSDIRLSESNNRYLQLYPMASINYDRKFGDHAVKGLLLTESIETQSNSFSASRRDLISAEVPQLSTGGDQNIGASGGASEGGRLSYVGRANYSYLDKYLFEATFRYDANAQFAPDTRWGFFPSVSAGWRISDESFMDGTNSWLEDLKIRASYSQLGNDRNISGYPYITGYDIIGGRGYLIGDVLERALRSTGLPNLGVTWENMTIYNVGLDFTAFQGKLTIEADYFDRTREGILARRTNALPSTVGAVLPQENLNSQRIKGVEAMVRYRGYVGPVKFTISPNITYSRSEWVHYEEPEYTDPDDIRLNQLSGQYTNRRFGYVSEGMFMSQEEIENHPIDQDQNGNTTLIPGDIKYKDINEDGVINSLDRDVIGRGSFPDMTYGLNLNTSYKGFVLDVLFQGASKFDLMVSSSARYMFANGSIPLEYQAKYRWTPDPNDPSININPEAKLPAATIDGTANNKLTSDFWLLDGTYLRLKNINLAYNLKQEWTSKIGLSNVQFYLSGTNLVTFSKLGIYKNALDPETPSGRGNYPLHRNYTLGLRFSL
ncbi:TonB-dependent receptor [Echinicola sediminis]